MSAPSSRGAVRPWLLVVLGVVVAGTAAYLVVDRLRARRGGESAAAAVPDTRDERQRASLRVAPGPLPRALPLVGLEGSDADGYPLRYVDRAALRTLLYFKKWKELTAYFEQLQDAFESDPRKEYLPIDAGEAFSSAEPDLDASLDAWVSATPDSFAPYYARGSHRVGAMWARRGAKYAAETPEDDLRAMEDAAARGRVDLERAVKMRPRLVAAWRHLMRIAMAAGERGDLEAAKGHALRACPDCLQIHATHLAALTPRWGGDYAAMRAFAGGAPTTNPRLRVLRGYEDLDRAEVLELEERHEEALVAVDRALKAGEYWEYRAERAHVLESLKRYPEAAADLDRADASRPMHAKILSARARVRRSNQDMLAAGRDLLLTLRLDPTDRDAKNNLPYVLNGVMVRAQELTKEGKRDEALDASELALDIAPLDRQAHALHSFIALGDAMAPGRIAELERDAAKDPGDFRVVQQLDYALSRSRRFDRILELWNAYLARKPDDARAYMERAGTNVHLGRHAESTEDAKRACELGINEGCERAAGR